ncbi:MAG: hypothetical protein BroJett038_07030 [Chloroflexota bacterium]|nr:MAG: hypothetical protein BroJett038_07030 [Chloroflexota bacterium]
MLLYQRRLTFILFLTVCLLLIGMMSAAAQNTITLTGYIAALNGDPPRDSNLPPQQIFLLQDRNGQVIARLEGLDSYTAFSLREQEVRVTGRSGGTQGQTGAFPTTPLPFLEVTDIQKSGGQPSAQGAPYGAPAVSGSQPWINILCQFQGDPDVPHAPGEYNALFGNTYPGIDHYWRQISYDTVNIAGTATHLAWLPLPRPRSYYAGSTSTANANLDALFADCVNAANPYVNFTLYDGINMMFSDVLDCCAWGGWYYTSLDGQYRSWSVTWLPPWAQEYDYITHEMGHGFGLSHSSGPQVNPPSGLDIYISQWDVMSRSGGTCLVWDAGFGCIPPGTISYSLYVSGWIPSSRIATISPGTGTTITLERLRQPLSGANYLMAKIPINGSSSRYYTVEARFKAPAGQQNYDQNIPDSAIIIHDVQVGRGGWPGTNTGPALVVVDNPAAGSASYVVNGENGRWKSGETFYDAANDIQISVLSQGESSFMIFISNQLPGAPTLTAPAGGSAITSPAPVFTWGAVKYAAGYEIQVDTTNDFTSGAVIAAQTNSTRYTAPVLAAGRPYYWRVRTLSSGGTFSEWSATASFQLDSAANAAPLPRQFATTTPTLSWNRIPWASGYKIEVSRTTSFGAISSAKIVNGVSTLASQTDPLANGLYYWRVCPRRNDGAFGACSKPDSFVVNVP